MTIATGVYIITNAQQRNPVFLQNRNDEESIRGHYKPENAGEQTQAQWHWRITDLNNGCHSIQNVAHKRYANCGSRAGLKAHVMGATEEQQWLIQVTSSKDEYTIGTIDSPNFWMLPDKGKGTPVELFNIPTDRKCWWTFTNPETWVPVKEDATYGAYIFALNPLPILPFSPLRLDFVIIQELSEYSILSGSRMIAGSCGRLVSLRRVQSDALCVNLIEVTSSGSNVFFECSYDVVTFETLCNLGGPDISWEECNGTPSLPTTAMRALRDDTTKIAILNLGDSLFQQGGQTIVKLINCLAEHGITLILTPLQTTWENAFCGSVVFKELKEISSEFRRFRQEIQFSEYVVNYNKEITLPTLKKNPKLQDTIRQNIPRIIEVLKNEDEDTRSAAVAAFGHLAEYAELRDAIFKTVPKIFDMLRGTGGAAEAAASALVKLAEHTQFRDVISLDSRDEDGLTPLFRAASNGNEAVVRPLLNHRSINVNARSNNGISSLFYAAWFGRDAVARLLLAHPNVDVNARVENGRTPLSMAAENGNEVVVRLLLDHRGIDVDARGEDGVSPLSHAAWCGRNAVVRLLLAHPGVDVNSKGEDGRTPLSRAAGSRNQTVVRLLLDQRGIDVNARNRDGASPLLYAAWFGREAVVCLLLAHPDIDVNAEDKYGGTPLLRAAGNGYVGVVRLLLTRPGVNVNAKNKYGETPLSGATFNRHEAVVELLREKMGWRGWLPW